MKKVLTVWICLLISGFVLAQGVNRTAQGVKVNVAGEKFYGELVFYSPSIVRVVKYPYPMDRMPEKESLSVTLAPGQTKVNFKEQGESVVLSTSDIVVTMNKADGSVSFADKKGNTLLKEKGAPRFEQYKEGVDKGDYKVRQAFALDDDEAIYGLGQLQNGKMNQRNQTKYLIQGNVEDVVTFFQSVKGYGIFWDNYSPTTFADNRSETSFDSEVGECVDYYFMYGGNADGVIAEMRTLTGEVPMFPLWTYGFWQSKERYKSQHELVGVVRKYRELGVPLDGIIQDWQYWGSNYLWNAMDFLNAEFPDPKRMMQEIHGLNAKAIISIWSSFGPMTKPYRDLDAKNMLFNFSTWPQSGSDKWPPHLDYPSGVRVYDAYNPEARDIYWKYLKDGLLSVDMDGWWMDSTEPDHLDAKPTDLDTPTHLGSFRKVRNAYPLMSVGGVYTHQRAVSSDKRVFILTRSAFAGQQRYGANTWTGDVVASWETLAKQIPAGLNFSLCGIPHWNTDIGGFFLWEYPKKLADPDYRDLHVRWMQFGTFCPMMRSHGADAAREIYQFGKKGDPHYDAIEKYINLRYSLLPYIYSTSWEVTAHQSSFIRALMMDFPQDKDALDIADEYMFGKSILVSPVTRRATAKKSYLPKGADWYDFWTNEKFDGGQTVNKEAPLDIIPLYIKAGSILPIGPQVQYSGEKPWDNLEIRVYTGADGSFCLYEDEFDNYNYEKGVYTEIPMTWNDKSRTLTIGARKGQFDGMLTNRSFTVKTQDGKSRTVNYTGKRVKVKL